MKSINVYNALVAYRASKEAKWHDKNDVLTFEIDGNTVKFPFYLLDEHIKRFEKLAIEENKPIKPANVPISNKRCLALQKYYIEAKAMDGRKRKAAIKAFRKVEMPKNSVWFSGEILTPHDKASILELFNH